MKADIYSGGSEGNLKSVLLALFLAFSGSFLGAVWAAYMALRVGANVETWVSFSFLGAVTVCALSFALLKSGTSDI